MTRWTKEEEEKLLEMYQTGYVYDEMAEALGRSKASVRNKLSKIRSRGEEREEKRGPIYTEKPGVLAHETPEAQQIYDELILALLEEFHRIRETLPNLGKKHVKQKPRLYNNLCRIAVTLISLLKIKPEKISIKEWFDEIAIKKLPKEARREPRRVMQRWMRGLRKLSRTRRSSAV